MSGAYEIPKRPAPRVREAALGAGDSLIGKVLAHLRDEGVIEPLGTGLSASWRRL